MLAKNVRISRLPIGLKIAASYLIIVGLTGMILPLTNLGPNHPEFLAKAFFYKQGAYLKEIIVNILFIISGFGLFWGRLWARKIALIIILISTIYTANSFAWGFAGEAPSSMTIGISLFIVSLWNLIWFTLIYRRKNLEYLS